MRVLLTIALATLFAASHLSLCKGSLAQEAGLRTAQPSTQTTELPAPNQETVLLHKGTELCLRLSHTLSTQSSKQGERVPFQLGDDVFAEGTVVAQRGTEVSATIAELKKPGRGGKDGVLSLAFDPLRLANGQKVTLIPRHRPNASIHSKGSGRENYLLAGPLLPLLPFVIPFSEGMNVIVDEKQCLNYEVADDIPVNKTEIISRAPQDRDWKQHFREMVLRVRQQEQSVSSPGTARAEPETGNAILGFDLTKGREKRLAECKHCYSPVTCPDCFRANIDYWKIIFLQPDGIYVTIANPEKDEKYLGYDRIFQGNFFRIVGVFGSHFVAAQTTASSCKLVLFGTALGQAYWMDEVPCEEIVSGYGQEVRAGVSTAQLLERQWVGNVEPQPPIRRNIFFTDKAGARTDLPDSSHDRFDPAWIDFTHIIYTSGEGSGGKKHESGSR